MDTRAASLLRQDVAPPTPFRLREIGALLARLSVAVLIAILNTAFWICLVMAFGYLTGTEFSTRFLAIAGLSIMAISVIGLSLVMFDRR